MDGVMDRWRCERRAAGAVTEEAGPERDEGVATSDRCGRGVPSQSHGCPQTVRQPELLGSSANLLPVCESVLIC